MQNLHDGILYDQPEFWACTASVSGIIFVIMILITLIMFRNDFKSMTMSRNDMDLMSEIFDFVGAVVHVRVRFVSVCGPLWWRTKSEIKKDELELPYVWFKKPQEQFQKCLVPFYFHFTVDFCLLEYFVGTFWE